MWKDEVAATIVEYLNAGETNSFGEDLDKPIPVTVYAEAYHQTPSTIEVCSS